MIVIRPSMPTPSAMDGRLQRSLPSSSSEAPHLPRARRRRTLPTSSDAANDAASKRHKPTDAAPPTLRLSQPPRVFAPPPQASALALQDSEATRCSLRALLASGDPFDAVSWPAKPSISAAAAASSSGPPSLSLLSSNDEGRRRLRALLGRASPSQHSSAKRRARPALSPAVVAETPAPPVEKELGGAPEIAPPPPAPSRAPPQLDNLQWEELEYADEEDEGGAEPPPPPAAPGAVEGLDLFDE